MSQRTSVLDLDRSRSPSPVLSRDREDSRGEVDHVSRQVLSPLEFRKESIPDFQGRVSLLSQELEEYDRSHRVDAVGTYVLKENREEVEEQADRIEEVGGYVLIPDRRKFNPEDYLTQGKAPLWFSSRIGGDGIGRSVEMTKEVEDKDKDKKPDPDLERQQQFDVVFARMKFKLGLSKDNVVNYDIANHSMIIYDRNGKITGKYDLKDFGTSEEPNHPVCGGGGLKQLLRDHGIVLTDKQLREFSDELKGLNNELKKIIEPETGGKFAYVFEAGNKGNIEGLIPFIARGAEGRKILHEDARRGFFVKTMQRLELIDTNSKTWPRSDVHTVNAKGAAAFADIQKAMTLQRIIIRNIEEKRKDLQESIQALTPSSPAVPNKEEKKQIDPLKKEIQQLNRLQDEIRMIYQHEHSRVAGVNPTVLHLMLMQLNSDLTIPHHSIRQADGSEIEHKTKMTAKTFLRPIEAQKREYFGVGQRDAHGADVVKNNLVNEVAEDFATSFEKTVKEEHSSRGIRNWFKSIPMDLYPSTNPAHKEIQQLGTNMGALVYDIAERISTDPSNLRKVQFIEKSLKSGFARESRALELLIAAAIFDGDTTIRGYNREGETIQGVMNKSLAQFKNELQNFLPTVQAGDKLDEAAK